MAMISISFCKDSDGASLVNTNAGVKMSTFKMDTCFCAVFDKRPVFAAKKPAKQTIMTCTTAWNVRKETWEKESGAIKQALYFYCGGLVWFSLILPCVW
jgi:hypothetical protein